MTAIDKIRKAIGDNWRNTAIDSFQRGGHSIEDPSRKAVVFHLCLLSFGACGAVYYIIKNNS